MLVASGLLDVAWAYSVKRAEGFGNVGWGLASFVLLGAFIALLMRALTALPLGTAYIVWTGIGAAGSVLVGILLLGEAATPLRLVLVGIVLLGVVGLRLTSGT